MDHDRIIHILQARESGNFEITLTIVKQNNNFVLFIYENKK